MRNFYLLILLLITATNSFSQCIDVDWLNPQPQGNDLRGMQIYSDDTAYFVGQGSTFMRTYDGGATWYQNKIWGVNGVDVFFTNTQTGYVCGFDGNYGRLYKTLDAGVTWSLILSAPGPQQSFFDICFLNSDTGYMGASGGVIYKTVDAGATWTIKNTGGINSVQQVQFLTSQIGFALMPNTQVSRTIDGGDSWQVTNLPAGNTIKKMHFADTLHGMIITSGSSPNYKTSDGGVTWNSVNNSILTFKEDIYFTSVDTCYALSRSFGMYVGKSTDSATTFNTTSIDPYSYSYSKIEFSPYNKNIGYVTGAAGRLVKTTDGGATWNQLTIGFFNYLFDMELTGDSTAYVCSSQGFISKSTNLGETWSTLNTNTSAYFHDLNFLTDSIGFAVGDQGAVYKTTNAGQTWSSKPSLTAAFLYDIKFADATTGILCGAGGTIRKTIDGGNTWSVANSTTNHLLTQIFWAGNDTCYIAADSGIVLKSVDAGSTWQRTDVGMNFRMTGLWFFNGLHGLAGDDSQRIYRTYDGGTTWQEIYWGWGDPVLDLIFDDAFSGYFLQTFYSYAILQHSSDGGNTWGSAGYFMGDEMTTLKKHNGVLYACGYFGKIVKITPGIPEPVVQTAISCGPGAVALSCTSTGTNYWYDQPNTTIPLDSGNTFTTPFLTQSDTFYVSALDTISGCYSYKKAVPVYIYGTATASLVLEDTICNIAPSFPLTGGLPLGGVYSGSAVSNGSFNPAQAAIGNNTIIYTYTDSNSCSASDTSYLNVEICTSIDEKENSGIRIYPTVSSEYITIDGYGNSLNGLQIIIMDLLGNVVYTEKINNNFTEFKINIPHLSSGKYQIQIRNNKTIYSRNFVKI